MKVAHVLRKYDPTEWGGTESALQQLCTGLRRFDVNSTVFCPRIAAREKNLDPLAECGCELKRFKACLPIWGISDEQKRELLAIGGNLVSVGLIRDLWRESGISVIHTHTLGRLGGVALTVARLRKLPVVVTIHGGYLDLPDAIKSAIIQKAKAGWDWGRLFGALFQSRQLLAKASVILTCNSVEAELLRKKFPRQRVIVHPHGVFADRFRKDHREDAREAFPAICGRQVLLVVGRIDPQKNQTWLVEQAPEIIRQHPNSIIVLAGACTNESYGAELKLGIERAGLNSKIILAGGLPPADARLIGLYQEAAAVVLPSKAETFGMVILEAWAAGTPVIASRTSGASSLIRYGTDGWLFDLNDAATFHFALGQSLMRRELAHELIAEGRQRVCVEFDTAVLARRMKTIYDELVQN